MNKILKDHLVLNQTESLISEAMLYSLISDGKQIRPNLLLALTKDLSGNLMGAYDLASALEMVHTYSLVHDDLPAMDNDDVRRGKPSNHKRFSESTALLAGDALLTQAFQVIAASVTLNPLEIVESVSILSDACGMNGMILGQQIDLEDNFQSLEDLEHCYFLKTGKLFIAATTMACVVSQRSDLQEMAQELGRLIGIAFQYQDDILEKTSDSMTLGKSNQSDESRNKNTVVSWLGLEEAQGRLSDYNRQIDTLLGDNFPLTLDLLNTVRTRLY